MERLMYDIYIAEATMSTDFTYFNTAKIQEAYIREVFRRHRVTQEQWNASLDWYSDRIDIYLQMNDSVMARLARERDIIEAKIAQRQAWDEMISASFNDDYIPRTYAFWTPSVRHGFAFRFDADELADRFPFDEFSFRFNVIGIPPTGAPDFRAVLRLEYADTTIFVVENIEENRDFLMPIFRYIERDSIQFAADSIQFDTLRHLSGFVRLPDFQREFRNIQLFDIALGIEYEEEYLYDDEEKRSWFGRFWQRIVGSRQNDSEDNEEERDGGGADFFYYEYYQYEYEDYYPEE